MDIVRDTHTAKALEHRTWGPDFYNKFTFPILLSDLNSVSENGENVFQIAIIAVNEDLKCWENDLTRMFDVKINSSLRVLWQGPGLSGHTDLDAKNINPVLKLIQMRNGVDIIQLTLWLLSVQVNRKINMNAFIAAGDWTTPLTHRSRSNFSRCKGGSRSAERSCPILIQNTHLNRQETEASGRSTQKHTNTRTQPQIHALIYSWTYTQVQPHSHHFNNSW